MSSMKVLNMAGAEVGTVELNDEIFGITPNPVAVHEVVKNHLANCRQGTQSALTRAEVSGGGRKPWRQKGTGHARQGSTRAPQWTHGGIVFAPKPRDYSYVLMNIPYGEFYKAELNENAAAVDAVSSATKNKTRNGSLAGGSYHVNPDGSDITGVTYPVRVKTSDLSGLKQVTDSDSVSITVKNKKDEDETSTYIGKDALFESASYSYYVLSSTPSYYKEATLTNGKWSFGKATGAASEATATIAKFKAPGHHANYEMEIESDKIAKGKKVYAVVLTATDGTSCGLHHVTEIWHVTKLGFKADPALVGKTISAVTYYTEDGIIKLNLAQPQYIPYIAKDAKAEVAKSDADAKSTTLTLTGFPEDFKQEVKVPDGMTYSDGKITFGSALPGSYTVTVSDAKNKYASVSTTFVLSTNTAVADYNDTSKSLVKATDASDTAFANYLKNITSCLLYTSQSPRDQRPIMFLTKML